MAIAPGKPFVAQCIVYLTDQKNRIELRKLPAVTGDFYFLGECGEKSGLVEKLALRICPVSLVSAMLGKIIPD